MSFSDVMAELPTMTVAERQLLVREAMELDDQPLSPEDEKLIETRMAEYERDPSSAISFEEMKRRLRARSER